MNDNTPPTRTPTDGSGLTSRVSPQPYAPPAVVWRETYVPEAFGVSCALQPGNPGCSTGPTTF